MTKKNSSVTMQAVRAAAEARIPVMIVGAPGVGKTATIRALAKSMGYELLTLVGSQMDPTDIAGLPKGEVIAKTDEGEDIWGTVYLAPWWQGRILQKKKVILFLDEFSNTSSAVRAAMLTLLQNREFPNGNVMPDETIVIGAMNPTNQAADGWELDMPTTNRIIFLSWTSPRSEWLDGMLNAWGEEVSEEEMFWRKRVISFINENPMYLHKENGDGQDGSSEALGINVNDASQLEVLRYAWASRRSWDNLTRVLAFTDRRDISLQDEISSGTVGRAAALAFRDWLLANDVVDYRKVLNNPKAVDWTTMEVSDINIIFRAILEDITPKNWPKVIELLHVIAEAELQGLVSPYVTEIITKIITVTRSVSKAETDLAKTEIKGIVMLYNKIKAPAQKAAA